jgi:hypothetical protein
MVFRLVSGFVKQSNGGNYAKEGIESDFRWPMCRTVKEAWIPLTRNVVPRLDLSNTNKVSQERSEQIVEYGIPAVR